MGYYRNVLVELHKAYPYFEDVESYLQKVADIISSDFLDQLGEYSNIKDAKKSIFEKQSKFDNEIEKLFFIRILIDNIVNFIPNEVKPNYHYILSQLETEFNQNISDFIQIREIDGKDKLIETFSNGLIWEIEKVLTPVKISEEHFNDFKIKNYNSNTNKIDWRGHQRLLPYLFKLLHTYKFIDEKDIFKLITDNFTSKGKPIDRVSLTSNYSQADYEGKFNKDKPKDILKMDLIAEKLKEIEKILDSMT
jgi:hypothetical protein